MTDDPSQPAPTAPRPDDPDALAPGVGSLDDPEPEKAPWVLVAQFFVIPLLVVLLSVAVFLAFGWFSREQRSPKEYLQEVRTGSLNRRWQAAFELARELARDPALARNDALFQDALASFEGAREEPRIRRYLALALGHFARPEAVRALALALDDPDEETRVYAALALGSIRSPEGVAPLQIALKSEAPALRKVAAFALGQIGDASAAPALAVAAEDRHFDVALQAACSLAQLGSDAGLPILHQALERSRVDAVSEMSEAQRAEAMTNAMRALVLLRDQSALVKLGEIGKSDANLGVRDAALRAIDAMAVPPATPEP